MARSAGRHDIPGTFFCLKHREDLLDEVHNAVIDMEAREWRREGVYRTGGDNYDAGIDDEIDSNAPKELRLLPNKRGKP